MNGNQKYEFVSWSNGGSGSHNYTVPDHNETLTAIYAADGVCDANTNLPPLAFADEITLSSNATRIINVLENDADSGGELAPNTVAIGREPQHGQVTVDSVTGSITYSHDGSVMTSDSFTYTVKDDQGAVSNEATVLITISAGSCGKGIELDGSIDFVNIPNLTLAGDFTIEGWVKLAPGIDNKDAMFGQKGAGPDLNFYAGKARLFVFNDKVVANTALTPDTWEHIAITRSGANLILYMNGAEDATGNWNGSLSLNAIGRGNAGFLQGMLDEVRIWNIARTGAEINASYNTSVDSNTLGLIGYWTFNGTDQVISDASGAANHGSLGINTAVGADDPVRLDSTAPLSENCDGGNTGGNTNVGPVANNDTAGPVQAGGTTSFTVTGNDVDSDGNLDASSVEIISEPGDGTATVNSSGTISYTNTGTTATIDILSYKVADTEGVFSNEATVSITVTDPTTTNEIPVAQADTAIVQAGESVLIKVLSNDSDSDGSLDKNSLTLVNQASNGTVEIDLTTGEMTYTHDGTATTSDSFTYTIEDDQGAVSNEATVSITISSTVASCGKGVELDGSNDWVNIPDLTLAGDFTLEGWVKLAPGIDNKDAMFGQEGAGPDLNFYAGKARLFVFNDKVVANTALTPDTWEHIAITRSGANLILYMNGAEDATGNWNGSLSLNAIGRGNAGFLQGMLDEVRIWNIARTGAEINASYNTSVDSNTLGLIGYWTFNGTDQVISDASGAANHGSLGINTAVGADDPVRLDSTAPLSENCDGGNTGGNTNVGPVANNDTAGPVQAGGTTSFTVTGNDVDSDGNLDASSVEIISEPGDGTATVNSSGTISYTNTGTTATIDILSYKVADTEGVFSNEATVSITVTDPTTTNEIPVAQADTAIVQAGESVLIKVLSNDSDSDGSLDKNSLTLVNQASNGTVEIDLTTGEMTYTHDGTATTSDSFTYTIEDDQGAVSNEATVSITISSTVASCGKGVELDGSNDWVNIPDLTLAGDFTLEGWVKLAPGIDNKDAMFGQEGAGPDLNFYAGKARLFVFNDKVVANTALTPDTWEHIAITRSGANLILYMNGAEDATGNWNGSLSLKAIGRGNAGFLQGMLDEVRIWNIARTGAEINASYNTSVDSNALGLIGYWTFNGTDQVISDASGAANHGSLGINTAVGADDPVRLDSTAPLSENCDGGNTGGNTNVGPVANNDTAGPVQAGGTTSFTVTGNDVDSDGNLDASSVEIISEPGDGTATVNSSGTISYTNTGTTATIDILSYKVADTEGVFSNEATVSITVTDPTTTNEIPVAQADTAIVQAGESVLIKVLSNDSDSDGSLDKNSLALVNQASNGTVEIDLTTGEMTYTHDGTATTSDSFTYTIEDDQGAVSNEATVSITISSTVASCGKGVELDGSNDWVNIPDLTLAGDFTLEGWVKLAPGIDNKDAMFGQEGAGPDLNFYAGKARLFVFNDKVVANTALTPDTWEHIAITRSGANLILYMNGAEDATGNWNGSLSLKAIGRGNAGFLQGMLDEVRIWNIARTGAEINASYNTSVDSNAPGLIGYWTFNGTDQVINDASGAANHGSLGINTTVGGDDPVRLDLVDPPAEICDEGNT